jgi:carboxyl-terminal processing protease
VTRKVAPPFLGKSSVGWWIAPGRYCPLVGRCHTGQQFWKSTFLKTRSKGETMLRNIFQLYRQIPLWWIAAALLIPSGKLSAEEKTSSVLEDESNAVGAQRTPAADDRAEYYRLFSLLADAIAQVEENYIQPIDRKEIFTAAIRGVMRELDPHSSFIEAEDFDDFRQEVESEFGGLGMQVTLDRQARLTVISPFAGTPAYRAGIHAGDQIMAIQGESTEDMRLDEAVKRLKGRSGTKVEVTIQRAGRKEPIELEITREQIHVPTVLGWQRNANNEWSFLVEKQPPIGYIRLTGFSRNTAAELRQALTKLDESGMRALILDLRFNPGGLLSSAVEVADTFVSNGLIVATDGRNIQRYEWNANPSKTVTAVPMAVLVNRYSASASEVVAACLQDHERAKIVGERTWGKGSVQNVVELEGGLGALKLTTASYHRPSGENIHRFPDAQETDQWGVKPDDKFGVRFSLGELNALILQQRASEIVTVDSPSGKPRFEDRQLKRAVTYLRKAMLSKKAKRKTAG